MKIKLCMTYYPFNIDMFLGWSYLLINVTPKYVTLIIYLYMYLHTNILSSKFKIFFYKFNRIKSYFNIRYINMSKTLIKKKKMNN